MTLPGTDPDAGSKYAGWIVARQLLDDDGVLKWFAFYPAELNGPPRDLYETEEEAEAAMHANGFLQAAIERGEVAVMRYEPRMYVNRY